MLTRFVTLFILLAGINTLSAQVLGNEQKDSLYIYEVQDSKEKDKVLHAEPLYIDLIRDLGARKGEKEWNVGLGLLDKDKYDEYEALVEYEWAPVDRLGLEVELPFSFYYPLEDDADAPTSRLHSLKLAAQYSFLVSEKAATSLALGYIHEFELPAFGAYSDNRLLQGHVFNPFFIGAKRWGNNFHTLLYTGPVITKQIGEKASFDNWQVNSNVHYMIPGTRNFVGIEFNKEISEADFDMTIRPQMRVALADNLMVGIVAGVPVNRELQRFSSFLRLIYEPGHKLGH